MDRLSFLKRIGLGGVSLLAASLMVNQTNNIQKFESENIKPLLALDNAAIIMTSKYINDSRYPGLYGAYITLPLNKRFLNGDIITIGNDNTHTFWVSDELIYFETDNSFPDGYTEYWVHRVQYLNSNKANHFVPKKYLMTGTRFFKVQHGGKQNIEEWFNKKQISFL